MQKPVFALLCLVFAMIYSLSETAEAKVIEARRMNWWGGAPACLDIPGSSVRPGQRIQLWPCHNQPNQNFTYDERTGFIRTYQKDQCIDLDDGRVEEGRKIALWDCWNGDPQKFRYEKNSGLIRYRADENFCIGIQEDLKELELVRCDASDHLQAFEIKNAFGERRLDEVSFVTSHNAHVSSGEAAWFAPNQSRKITDQLKDGVRGFMVDTYSRKGKIELCHGNCDGFPGIGYANPRQTFETFLNTVADYMKSNPDVIITLHLEDYADPKDMRKLMDSLPELRKLIFNPYAEKVRDLGWPTIDDMIARNKRLLFISSRDDKKDLGFGFAREFTVENYWSLGALGNKTECKSRWDDIPLDKDFGKMQPLFVMNQFRDIPTGLTASLDNRAGTLLDRIEDKCMPAAKRKPNFVAVDFYEAASSGVFKVVETLNQTVAVLFKDEQFTGKAKLLQPGEYNKDHLGIGSDSATSILIFRHGAVDLFEHDKFTGFMGRLESSSPNIGNDLNDRISSVKVEYL